MPKYDYEYYSGAESDQFRFLRNLPIDQLLQKAEGLGTDLVDRLFYMRNRRIEQVIDIRIVKSNEMNVLLDLHAHG